MGFCQSRQIYPASLQKKLIETATKTGLDAAKSTSKKVVHKIADATGELIGKEIAEKVMKPKHVPEFNSRTVKETVISSEKRQRNFKHIKTSIIKLNTAKYLNY